MYDLDRRQFLAAAGGLAAVSLMPANLPAAIMLEDPLKVAVVGVGRQGRAILAELDKLQAVKVVAVCESDEQRLTSAKSRAPDAVGFASHKEMLDKAKDAAAVIIATPTHLHKQIALDCISAGRHIYCEAPLAHTVEDAREIAKAAAGFKAVFAVGHEGRSNPVYGLARSFFKTDAFKDMIAMRAGFSQKTTWRFGAADAAREKVLNWRLDKDVSTGLMGEIGSHQFDVVHWYRGKQPVSVRAGGGVRFYTDGREVADTVYADFEFEDGAMLHYTATLASSYEGKYEIFQGSGSTIKLAWTHGWMFKETDAPTQGWEVYANKQPFHNDVGITLIADATKLAAQGKLKDGVGLPYTSLYYALENFVAAVAAGKPAACTAADGMRTAVVSILAHQAAVKNEMIRIDPNLLKVPA